MLLELVVAGGLAQISARTISRGISTDIEFAGITTTLLTGLKDGRPFTLRASRAIVTGKEEVRSSTMRAKLLLVEGLIEITGVSKCA